MHFYPHNIADFNNSTRHLTRVERSVYRDAIDRYYDTECALPANDFDRLCRVLLCVADEEKAALKVVLDEFFTLADGAYHHSRCDIEIEKYRLNTSAKARAGKASAESRKNKSKQTLNTRSTDEQLTNNQELITNNQDALAAARAESPAQASVKKNVDEFFNDDTFLKTIRSMRPELEPKAEEIKLTFLVFWRERQPIRDDWLEQWAKWLVAEK